MKKKKQTDAQIMWERSRTYGPVSEQMAVIGSIQMELTRYCLERNEGNPSRKALAHLSAMNQGVVKMVRSVSNPDHEDNFMEALEIEARKLWRGAFVARENMRINLI